MRIKKILILLSVGFSSVLFGQNGNFSSLPMFNQMYYNPGYAGDGNDMEAKFLFRDQWMNLGPSTVTFSFDAPFKLFGHRHGAGATIVRDEAGIFQNTEVNLSYAYRKSLIQGELGIGIGIDLISHGFVENEEWRAPDGSNGDNDYAIPQLSVQPPMLFDANIGLYYRADNLFMSVSSRNFTNTEVEYSKDQGTEVAGSSKQLLIGRQLYFSTGYDYQLPNPMFSIQPGAFIGSDFASTQLSVSGIVTYNKRFFGGLAYKNTDAIITIVGLDLPSGIHAAVSYDITTSRLTKYSSGSLEFMLGYKFSLDIDKDNRKYKSVRFL